MTYKLFIDDERDPVSPDCVIVRSSAAAIQHMIAHGCAAEIMFDHDLGGADTAMVVVRWLIEQDLDHPGFIPGNFVFSVHSANPIGKNNITGLLAGYLEQREC